MGMEEEILQLTVEVKNAAQIAATDAQLKAMEGTVASLTADFKAGAIAEEQFLAAMKQAATQAGQLEASLKTLKTPASLGGLDQQKITGLSYAMNDFFAVSGGLDQRLNAVANNLPMLLSGFGSLGLVLSGVVPIVAMLVKNWGSIEEKFNLGIPRPVLDSSAELARSIKADSDEFEKLGEKARLSLAELVRYKELGDKIAADRQKQKDQKETEAIEAIKGTDQEQAAAGFKKAVAAAGGGEQATRDLIQAITNIADRTGQSSTVEGVRAQAEGLMRGAMQGNRGDRDTITRAIAGGMPADQRGLAQQIVAGSPEEAARRKANEEDIKRTREAEANAAKARDEREKRVAREAAEARQSPEFKEAEDTAKRLGYVDKFGRKIGQEGFDADSAAEVARKMRDEGVKKAKGDGTPAEQARDAIKAHEDEVKKIEGGVGKPMQQRYEQLMAQNALAAERGMPAMDPARLAAMLKNQMVGMMKQGGFGLGASREAAQGIADKGDQDLQKRMAQLNNEQGTNQAKLITLSAGLSGEMARAVQVQQRHGQAINALMQGQQARQRTGRSRGRGG